MSLYRFFLELLKSIKIKLRISYFGPYNIRYYPKEIREISLRFKSDINLNQYHQYLSLIWPHSNNVNILDLNVLNKYVL